ncbi:MAG: alpha/beta hydrolase [Halioglobus sp.]
MYWPIAAREAATLPVIVFYHGGGFVVGSIDIFESLTRALASATASIVVSAGYRLAPAHPYPAAITDAYAALEWVAGNLAELGGDPDKLMVAGESAGGNLATVVAMMARDLGGPEIAAEILYYPGTDFTDTPYPSMQKFADGYGLSSGAMRAFRQAYAGRVADKTTPYLSPMSAPSLANMPPTLMVTAGFDPLADSGRAYARRLEKDAVAVNQQHFSSMIHGFMNINLFPQRRQALEATAAFVEGVLANPH